MTMRASVVRSHFVRAGRGILRMGFVRSHRVVSQCLALVKLGRLDDFTVDIL